MKKHGLWLVLLMDKVFAAAPQGMGLVAGNLMGPVSYASDFISATCYAVGSSFLLSSLVKYMQYRRNPLAMPLSTVFFLVIAGLFLIALPFAYQVINHGTSYTLMK